MVLQSSEAGSVPLAGRPFGPSSWCSHGLNVRLCNGYSMNSIKCEFHFRSHFSTSATYGSWEWTCNPLHAVFKVVVWSTRACTVLLVRAPLGFSMRFRGIHMCLCSFYSVYSIKFKLFYSQKCPHLQFVDQDNGPAGHCKGCTNLFYGPQRL